MEDDLVVKLMLNDLELCLTAQLPGEETGLRLLIKSDFQGVGHNCRILDRPSRPELALFRYFRFPTLHLTKL